VFIGILRVAETLLDVVDAVGRNILGMRGEESVVVGRGEDRAEEELSVGEGLLEEGLGTEMRLA
jgi:hypothetical protein